MVIGLLIELLLSLLTKPNIVPEPEFDPLKLDKAIGIKVEDIPDLEPKMLMAWIATPYGFSVPLVFSPVQWTFVHELASINNTGVEEMLIEIARDKYFR